MKFYERMLSNVYIAFKLKGVSEEGLVFLHLKAFEKDERLHYFHYADGCVGCLLWRVSESVLP